MSNEVYTGEYDRHFYQEDLGERKVFEKQNFKTQEDFWRKKEG